MATAKAETGLSLDSFAAILGIHPLHFNQISVDGITGCGGVWLQYDWQMPSAVSRESVALAIQEAENDLESFLGFPTYPKWFEEVKVPIPVTHQFYHHMSHYPIVLPKANYIEGGKKAVSLVSAGETITYSDTDLDGFFETATVTVATSVTDKDEIAVYYPDEFDGWQIKPIKVAIASGVATIIMNRYDLVNKIELENLKPARIDGLDNAKFLETVDVYRVYNDPSTQIELHAHCHRCLNGCSACQFWTYTGCLQAEDHKNSIVDIHPANWNTDTLAWVRDFPHCMGPIYDSRVWFKAGWTGPHIWDQAIAYLAITRLPLGLCACPTVKDKIAWWSIDMAEANKDRHFRKIPEAFEDCPWGWTRGATFAFNIARKHKMAQGATGGI